MIKVEGQVDKFPTPIMQSPNRVIVLQQPCGGQQVVAILDSVSSKFASVAF